MRVRVAREDGPRLEDAVAAVLPVEPYLPYANFPPIAGRGDGALGLNRRWWIAAGEGQGVLVARDGDDRPLGLLRLAERAFESQHFGLSMAKIELPVAAAEEAVRLPALRALYRAAFDTLRERGVRHLSAVSPTQDRAACWALQEIGCFHVGTRITWMAPLTGDRREHALTPHLRIERHEGAAIRKLDPTTWRRLHEWTGSAFDRGPFVFDLNVPRERAGAVYRVWTEKALTGEWADVLLVVRDGDEIVAFNAMLLLRDLSEAAGVGILGRGIGASLPGYRGLFTALQNECAAVRPLGAGFLENETQAASVPTINVFGRLGHRCIHSVASFHVRLGGDAIVRGG
jgi:hypothetical protein